jgi:D-tyrosyl-tRNA(Tyr) deacylase
MRAVLQRVSRASVEIDGSETAAIGRGLLVLAGIEQGDTAADIDWLAAKTVAMRIFGDEQGKMNRSVVEIGGEVLVVSQFTLHASTKKGNRPSFLAAARPDEAIPLYERFLVSIEQGLGRPPQAGVFAADMQVSLVNDGPVTIVVDSRRPE